MDKSVLRSKEATKKIQSMEEKFTMDLELMIDATKRDSELADVIEILTKKTLDEFALERFYRRKDLSTRFGLLLYKDRIVVSEELEPTVVHLLHTGHIGRK